MDVLFLKIHQFLRQLHRHGGRLRIVIKHFTHLRDAPVTALYHQFGQMAGAGIKQGVHVNSPLQHHIRKVIGTYRLRFCFQQLIHRPVADIGIF